MYFFFSERSLPHSKFHGLDGLSSILPIHSSLRLVGDIDCNTVNVSSKVHLLETWFIKEAVLGSRNFGAILIQEQYAEILLAVSVCVFLCLSLRQRESHCRALADLELAM